MASLNQFTLHIKSFNQKIPTAELVCCLCRLQRWHRRLCPTLGDRVALCPSLLTKTLSWGTPCSLYCPMQFLWDKFHEGELREWGDVSEPEQLASHSGASTEGAASCDLFLPTTMHRGLFCPGCHSLKGTEMSPTGFYISETFPFGETRASFEVPTIVKNSNCFKRDIAKMPWQFLGRSASFYLGKSGGLSRRRELSLKKQVRELPWWSSG